MQPEHWSRVKRLFEAALQKTPTERAAYLAGISELDAELRQEVERLLGADRDDSFLQELPEPEISHSEPSGAPGEGEPQETRVGRYRLLKEIGRVTRDEIFIGVLNSFSVMAIQRRIRGWFKPSVYNLARFYSLGKLRKLINRSLGFNSVKWGSVLFFPSANSKLIRLLDRKLSFRKNPFNAFLGIVIKL